MTDKIYVPITELNSSLVGQHVWVRGRLHTSRAVGAKGAFLVLRAGMDTVQCTLFATAASAGGAGAAPTVEISKSMVKYGTVIPRESIVDVKALVTAPPTPVEGTTKKNLELSIIELWTVSKAEALPFLIEDASRNEEEAVALSLPTVAADTRLNYRWVDLRTASGQAIFRIQAGVCRFFREFLTERGFVEIHSPKLLGGASEGGANVFKLKYFDQSACLAQSPQLYKQMAAACAGFERVFEIGPVFRAENSNTHRHLCEFTGLDLEMAITEHYHECMTLMGDMFTFIFDGLNAHYRREIEAIRAQYPFEDLQYCRPALRLTFPEGIALLKEDGADVDPLDDLSTEMEKRLGRIVKRKYGTDFFMMDKYPLGVRPFYTMPDPAEPTLSNSYDMFIRGEEIVSGAQRVHEPAMLAQRAVECGIPVDSIQSYIDAFRHGALPHAGGGVGLERVVMLFLGLHNIRRTSMFPRDPSRLTP